MARNGHRSPGPALRAHPFSYERGTAVDPPLMSTQNFQEVCAGQNVMRCIGWCHDKLEHNAHVLVLLCYKTTIWCRIVLWAKTSRQAHRSDALRHISRAWLKPQGMLTGTFR